MDMECSFELLFYLFLKPTSQPANARASRTDSVSIGGDSQRYNTVNKKFR